MPVDCEGSYSKIILASFLPFAQVCIHDVISINRYQNENFLLMLFKMNPIYVGNAGCSMLDEE